MLRVQTAAAKPVVATFHGKLPFVFQAIGALNASPIAVTRSCRR